MANEMTYQGTIKQYRICGGRIAGILEDSQRPDEFPNGETVVTTAASIHEGVAITRSGSIYVLLDPAEA
jgi:hypothetical protein